MEIVTYIENPLKVELPQFKHPTKSISTTGIGQDKRTELSCSEDISIPDKIIMNPCLKSVNDDAFKCFLLFGYQLRLKDWENIRKTYPNIGLKVKLYRGNQVTQISQHIFGAKSFLKGQRNINEPQRTLIKRQQKQLQSFAHMYTVEITSLDETECTRLIYYLPTPHSSQNALALESLKCRYFNHKFLQILCEYVSLDNNNTSCYKDMAHHEFEAIVYSGKVSSFQILVKFPDNTTQTGRNQNASKEACEVWESFLQKLSPISMTDKHLLDEVDPLDFTEIKKEIRSLYLEQKRIRKSLAFEKIRIVEEIESAIQFLNLKQVYPQKITYNSISSEMLKKIRNQNLQNKTSWIKQQNFIIKNLDARIIELEQTKQRYKIALLQQQKSNNDSIQQIRAEIKFMEASIRYEQADKVNQKFQEKLHMKNKSNVRQNTQCSKNAQARPSLTVKKSSQIMKQKQELQQLEKQKILKFEMVRAEFEAEKEFSRRKAEYARAAEDLFNYLTDC